MNVKAEVQEVGKVGVNKRIEAIANNLAQKCNSTLPVNPAKVARELGIEVFSKAMDDTVDGVLAKNEENYQIFINNTLSKRRARFTVAHELGHYILHASSAPENGGIVDYRRDLNSSFGIDAAEIEANNFAAALLMNAQSVSNEWACYKNIPVLADRFGVSEDAIKYRLKNLGLL